MISVVVPVYKVEPYLNRCIQSIVNQTYKQLQIILVDDGSPDSCGEICDSWAEADSRICVIHQKNAGLSAARNAGIAAASGEYLMFVDSDDYIEPDMAQKLFEASKKYDADVTVCNFLYEFETEELRKQAEDSGIPDYQIHETMVMDGQQYLQTMKFDLIAVAVVAWNKLYRKECFSSLRYPVGRYHEDEFVIYPLMYPVKRVACITYTGYHYTIRSGGIMGSGSHLDDLMDMYAERCAFCLEQGNRALTERSLVYLMSMLPKAKKRLSSKHLVQLRIQRAVIARKMHAKGWISTAVFIKRLIGCLLK